MKLVRFGSPGHEKYGVLDEGGVVRDPSEALARSSASEHDLEAVLNVLRGTDPASLPSVSSETRLGVPVSRIGKIVCVGLNYSDHAAESGLEVPSEPVLFMKATTALSGPNDDICIPPGADKTDWEVELGVVIGKRVTRVREQEALAQIAGYCVVHDVSERAYQLERSGQWLKGKSLDTFCPVGPYLATPDEIGDPQALPMHLLVNGERMQDGSTSSMVFGVAFLIHYISQFMTLEPGDLISTGTPWGVGMGRRPPVYLKDGDIVELGIETLGVQRQHVRRLNG